MHNLIVAKVDSAKQVADDDERPQHVWPMHGAAARRGPLSHSHGTTPTMELCSIDCVVLTKEVGYKVTHQVVTKL